ncbi:hypothetical protein HNQ85_001905 [Anoxybacillus calidus]|uniref:VWFA domain-containing protein n=1 Tax=[Anoxybacillus] calidus TaxID=575178 RepID=A0A7W0BVJ9_9BACL|nr:hypothetical protein [Anoxybacillus calidus]
MRNFFIRLIVFFISFVTVFASFVHYPLVAKADDKKDGTFTTVNNSVIKGIVTAPGKENGKGNTVTKIEICVRKEEDANCNQTNTFIATINNVNEGQGMKTYEFSVNMSDKWPDGLNTTYEITGKAYRKLGSGKEKFYFDFPETPYKYQANGSSNPIEPPSGNDDNELSLTLNSVEPTKKESFLENGVALSGLNFSVNRNGMLSENPRKPIDVVFVFDKSGSMDFKISSNSSVKRITRAKEAMQTAATVFKNANMNRTKKDRFGLVVFDSEVTTYQFGAQKQTLTENIDDITKALNSVTAEGATNYSNSLEAADQIFAENPADSRSKYIIFLTDGEPTFLKTDEFVQGLYHYYQNGKKINYPYTNLLGKHSQEIIYVVDSNDRGYIYNDEFWIFDYYYQFMSFEQNPFYYNGKNIYFSEHASVYIQNHAKKVSQEIKDKGIKLYPIGFGESKFSFLQELSSKDDAGQPLAKNGNTENLNTIFEALVKDIDTPAFTDVRIEVKLPNNVSVDGSHPQITTSGGYAMIRPEGGKVKYEVGQPPGPVNFPSLPLKFTAKGEYNFEVTLKYKDLNNQEQVVRYDKPITIKVDEEVHPSFTTKMEYALPQGVIVKDHVIQFVKTNSSETTKNTFELKYSLTPYAKLPVGKKGTLSNITIKQKLPLGVSLADTTGVSEQTLPDGTKEITFTFEPLSYESKSTGMWFSDSNLSKTIRLKIDYAIPPSAIANPTIEFYDSNIKEERQTATVTSRFYELMEMNVFLIDEQASTPLEYKGTYNGEIVKYIRDSGKLEAATHLNDNNGVKKMLPIKALDFHEGNRNILVVAYADNTEVLFKLTPEVAIESANVPGKILEHDGTYQYTVYEPVSVFWSYIVPGAGTQYEYSVNGSNPLQVIADPSSWSYDVNVPGTTTIKVKATGGFLREPFEKTLTIHSLLLIGITLDQYNPKMNIGESQVLRVLLNPDRLPLNAFTFNWSSSDSSIATVTGGTVKALKEGTVTLTVYPEEFPNKKATATITVTNPVIPLESIRFRQPTLSLTIGEKIPVASLLEFNPSNATNKKLESVSSSASQYVEVTNEKGQWYITARNYGYSTVTAIAEERTNDGQDIRDSIVIIVTNSGGGDDGGGTGSDIPKGKW